jgi:hypothetical protein
VALSTMALLDDDVMGRETAKKLVDDLPGLAP